MWKVNLTLKSQPSELTIDLKKSTMKGLTSIWSYGIQPDNKDTELSSTITSTFRRLHALFSILQARIV